MKVATAQTQMGKEDTIVGTAIGVIFETVRPVFDLRQVVNAHNLPYFQRKSLEEECRRLRIACHSIRSDGAFVAPVSPAVRNRKRVSD